MANKQNLAAPFTSAQSREEAAKNGRKGGIASGKARAERKLIKERILERMGESDWDDYIDGIIERAKISKADAEFLRDTVGEKPTEKVSLFVEDESTREMDEYFATEYGEAPEDGTI